MVGSASARQLSIIQLSFTRLAGEAINNLTPTANMGGEAVKVYLLRQYGVTSDVGAASVVAAKTALTVSQVAFIVIGLPFFLYRLDIGYHAWWIFSAVFVLAYGFVMILVRWQRGESLKNSSVGSSGAFLAGAAWRTGRNGPNKLMHISFICTTETPRISLPPACITFWGGRLGR